MQVVEPSVSGLLLRQLGGVNRIDSYDDPITKEYPLTLLADGYTLEGKGGATVMSIDSSGVVKTNAFIQNEVATDQDATHMRFRNPNGAIGKIRSIGNSMYFDGLVTSFAQVEGLEATLSAKDKLIEKLSKRLDSLEKRVK